MRERVDTPTGAAWLESGGEDWCAAAAGVAVLALRSAEGRAPCRRRDRRRGACGGRERERAGDSRLACRTPGSSATRHRRCEGRADRRDARRPGVGAKPDAKPKSKPARSTRPVNAAVPVELAAQPAYRPVAEAPAMRQPRAPVGPPEPVPGPASAPALVTPPALPLAAAVPTPSVGVPPVIEPVVESLLEPLVEPVLESAGAAGAAGATAPPLPVLPLDPLPPVLP